MGLLAISPARAFGRVSAWAHSLERMVSIILFNGMLGPCRFADQYRGRWAQSFNFDPFWFALARKGFKVAVFDAGQINHQIKVPCVQIVNWSYQATGSASSNPPELLAEVRRRFGYRPIGPEVQVPKGRRQCNAIRDSLLRAVKAKADSIIWLAETQDWQFLLAGMYELHRAGHNLWPINRRVRVRCRARCHA